MSREGRSQPVQPFASHGFLGNVPANGVLPPPVTVVDRVDQRVRYAALPPLVVSGVLASFTTAVVVPPRAQTVEPDDRRRARPVDTVVLRGLYAPVAFNDSGTCTLTLSGTGTESASHTSSGTCTLTLGGSGTGSQVHSSTGTCTLTLSGTGTQSFTHSSSGTATVTLAGTGVEQYVPPASGSATGFLDQVLEILHVTHRI